MRSALRLALVASLALAGCFNVSWGEGERVEGSGTSATRTVDVAGVRSVSLATPGTLVVTDGAVPLVIEGDDNLIDRIEAEVRDGELVVAAERGVSLRPQAPLRFTVGVDRLEGVRIAGSGRVEATRAQADALTLAIAGSGALDVSGVRADAVTVSVAGSGDVTVAGRAGRLAVEIAGSGDVDAVGLQADQAEVQIAGAGDVTLWAEKALDVEIMGAGDVRYAGSPEVTRSVMGAGEITRVER
ncbi:head GIN domain-containing protein [Rubrivirga sp.]|uniref:head GIN domain-containing protein n=1 Tax=Rubrivirga sp. TaxID=1885344 RepID=UPI003B529075